MCHIRLAGFFALRKNYLPQFVNACPSITADGDLDLVSIVLTILE